MPGGGRRSKKDVDTTKFYKLLDVEKNAGDAEIKKAYRKLAVKHHPDKAGGAPGSPRTQPSSTSCSRSRKTPATPRSRRLTASSPSSTTPTKAGTRKSSRRSHAHTRS